MEKDKRLPYGCNALKNQEPEAREEALRLERIFGNKKIRRTMLDKIEKILKATGILGSIVFVILTIPLAYGKLSQWYTDGNTPGIVWIWALIVTIISFSLMALIGVFRQ